MIHFKFTIQWKFRNKNYSSIILNFHIGLCYEHINLQLEFTKNKNIMRRGLLFSTLSFLSCLNHLSSKSTISLHSGFLNCFTLDLFCSNTPTVLALFLKVNGSKNLWDQIPTCQLSLFHSLFVASLTFPSIVKTFLLFITIAMLSHYQSPVNSSSGKVLGNFTHKVSNQTYYCHFPSLELM